MLSLLYCAVVPNMNANLSSQSSRRVSSLLWSAWAEDELWSASASNRELHGYVGVYSLVEPLLGKLFILDLGRYNLARCADAPTRVLDTGTVDSGAVLDFTCGACVCV